MGREGQKCFHNIPPHVHFLDTLIWSIFIITTHYLFDVGSVLTELVLKAKQHCENSKRSSVDRVIDYLLFLSTSSSWIMLLYYKVTTSSVINLIHPCHLTILIHSVALCSDGFLGIVIGVLSLPLTFHSLLANLFPAIDGLDLLCETEMFWVLHILIQIVPLWLLVRKNFGALELISLKSILVANWVMVVYHWWIVQPLDIWLQVNISFMLCPTESMLHGFELMPMVNRLFLFFYFTTRTFKLTSFHLTVLDVS